MTVTKKGATISSGHALGVSGAVDLVNEVKEARRITNAIADVLDDAMKVHVYHDDTSKSQRENINRIVAAHNKTDRAGDYSIHLNASAGRQQRDMGVEVLYYKDANRAHAVELANEISKATGLKNRGAKKRTDLGFLKGTHAPAWLIEAYFVNSHADVRKMDEAHEINAFAVAVARTITKKQGVEYKVTPKKPHRIKTGTYDKLEHAQAAKAKMDKSGLVNPKYTQVIASGGKHRVITGTFDNEADAKKVYDKMKDLKIFNVGYVVAA